MLWSGLDSWRAEGARIEERGAARYGTTPGSKASPTATPPTPPYRGALGMVATGTQLGIDPLPYRVDYRLEVGADWITRRLDVTAAGDGWSRQLDLRHLGTGNWICTVKETGRPLGHVFDPPGGNMSEVTGALDCDLANSPLTNVMPIRRRGLHQRPGSANFVMAWVSVPDLHVHASPQRYEHVRVTNDGSVVRFVSEDRSFTSELELNRDGYVVTYPGLATHV